MQYMNTMNLKIFSHYWIYMPLSTSVNLHQYIKENFFKIPQKQRSHNL